MKRSEILKFLAVVARPRLLTREEASDYLGTAANLETFEREEGLRPTASNGNTDKSRKSYFDIEELDRLVTARTARIHGRSQQP